ncbi:MAG: hypothetical protein HOP28_13120 [Gemmatimonadales bacterium]|nr:hypothetical protein [Gemmatimonadales bacterium]
MGTPQAIRAGPTRPRVLLICGSLNQTSQMHAIGRHLRDAELRYSPFYADGLIGWLGRWGALDFTVLGRGGEFRRMTEEYLNDHALPRDDRGLSGPYDLVVTCSDLVVQRNIRRRPIVLVQEGMTDPPTAAYRLVRRFGLPRWVASTSTNGLSLAYRKFCVASPGYRDLFVANGVPAERIAVTGIPNFDNCQAYLQNDFPLRGYVLVATSDMRETFKADNRRALFDWVEILAHGRPLVFKLHPNEARARATREILARFPSARVFAEGNTNHMIANCEALVTQYSSCVYVGLALGKPCHSYLDRDELCRLLPIQNGGTSGERIARVCEEVLRGERGTVGTSRAA